VAKMNRARRKGCFCCKYGWDWEKATKIVKFGAVGVGLVAGLVKIDYGSTGLATAPRTNATAL
jgi:hypothetical protein